MNKKMGASQDELFKILHAPFLCFFLIVYRNLFNYLILDSSCCLGSQRRCSDVFEYSVKKLHFFFHLIFV